jgi:hypothetical protein
MNQTDPIQAAPPSGWLARVAFGGLAPASLLVLWQLWRLVAELPATEFASLIERHGAALLGIPTAIALAFFVIGMTCTIEGTIEFDLLGLRASGAAAAIILWTIVFVATGLLIRAVW